VINIDQVGWRGQAHVEQRHKALPSRQNLRFASLPFEESKRVVKDRRRTVLKAWWFHRVSHLLVYFQK
jgi:hypothetical protein